MRSKVHNEEPQKRPISVLEGMFYLHSPDAKPLMLWRDRAALVAGCGTLLSVTILWAPIGNTAAYLAILCALFGTFLSWNQATVWVLLRQSWLWMLALGFVLLAIAFVSNDAHQNFSSVGDFVLFPFAFIFVVSIGALRGRISVIRLCWLFLVGAAAAALVGGFDIYVLGKDRANGLNNSPIHLADFAVLFGFMAMGGTLIRGPHHRWLLLTGPVLGLIAATLAGTRAAFMVAAVLAVVFALFVFIQRPESRWLKTGMVLAVGGGLGLIAVFGHLAGYTRPYETLVVLRELISGEAVGDASSAYRIEMYRAGLAAFWKAPIFGHGWHNQITAALPYMSEFGREGYASQHWAYLHNDLLGFAVSAGIFGIAAYILWLFAPFVALKNVPADGQSVVRLYLVTTLVFGLVASGTTDVLFMTELSKLLLIAIPAAVVVLCQDAKPQTDE